MLYSLFIFLVLLFQVRCFQTAGSVTTFGANETDHAALLAFKSKIKHDPQGALSSWNYSSHFCMWEGITCSRRRQRVTVLDLSFRGLVGSLSPHIGNLSFLRVFMLQNNSLEGEIPSQVGHLFRLQLLRLTNNSFEGEIPANLSRCRELVVLELNINKLVGRFPNELGSLSKVERLDFSDNKLTGGIPTSIGNLSSSIVFDVTSNPLGGTIPDIFSPLTNLKQLLLGELNLFGMIPKSIYNLSSLIELSLAANQLSGSLPKDIGLMFSHLQYFIVWGNNFTGPLPVSFSNCSELQYFDVAKNQFNGKIEIHFGGIVNLTKVNLGNNALGSGDFDEMNFLTSVANCSFLKGLDLSQNNFTGLLPSSVGNLSASLSQLTLGRNNLHGKIPAFLEQFSLDTLNLSFNGFEGEVPIIGVFTNASAISVVGNIKLCGGVPALQLPKCPVKQSKKHRKLSRAIIIVMSLLFPIFGFILLLSLFFTLRKKKSKQHPSSLPLQESFLQVSYQMLFEATDGFSSPNLIGMGSFGSVYKGLLQQGRDVVAIKVLNLLRQGASKSFMAECEALRNIRHRNLVKVITACSSIDFQGNDFKALVYGFMSNGSLEKWLHPQPHNEQDALHGLCFLERVNILIDVASAIDYLHHQCETPIVHCDIKPSNILLDEVMVAHVGDFGLAKLLHNHTDAIQSSSLGVRGTIGYAPPEYGVGSELSAKGDVYSYGILILEMMTGKRPTDVTFVEGLNLHNFVERSLSDDRMREVARISLTCSFE